MNPSTAFSMLVGAVFIMIIVAVFDAGHAFGEIDQKAETCKILRYEAVSAQQIKWFDNNCLTASEKIRPESGGI